MILEVKERIWVEFVDNRSKQILFFFKYNEQLRKNKVDHVCKELKRRYTNREKRNNAFPSRRSRLEKNNIK